MGNCTGKKKTAKQRDAAPARAHVSTNNDSSTYEPVINQTQQPPKSDVRLFVALFDYDARTSEDLTFKKGDYLEVKPENTAFDWCQAKSRSSQQEGYIPSNHVAEVNTLEAEE